MPWNEVMHKWGTGALHSGSPSGPKVRDQKQAIAIMLSEKRKAASGHHEYAATESAPIRALKKARD